MVGTFRIIYYTIVVHCWCVQQGSTVHWCAAVAYLGFDQAQRWVWEDGVFAQRLCDYWHFILHRKHIYRHPYRFESTLHRQIHLLFQNSYLRSVLVF